jgi:hypothetical protein
MFKRNSRFKFVGSETSFLTGLGLFDRIYRMNRILRGVVGFADKSVSHILFIL